LKNSCEEVLINYVIVFLKVYFEAHNFLVRVNSPVYGFRNVEIVVEDISFGYKSHFLLFDYFMDDQFEAKRQYFGPNFVRHIKEGDRYPILHFGWVGAFRDEGDGPFKDRVGQGFPSKI